MGDPWTRQRQGELARAVLAALADAADGLPIQDVLDRVAALTPPTPDEGDPPPAAGEASSYEKSIRRASMELAKAGWIRKSAGTWQITDSGRSALAGLSDPVALHDAAMGRRDPRITPAVPESVGDIFAGCFLSIAGALVGAIIGTIVSFVRMLSDLSLALLGGLVAGFVGGAVLGLLASFGIAGVVRHFGRHAEDIWVIATALASAVFGAVTAFLVIAGITGR